MNSCTKWRKSKWLLQKFLPGKVVCDIASLLLNGDKTNKDSYSLSELHPGHLVHEFIDTIQHIQPVFGIVRFGNSSIDTAGDLIDIVADMMDLRAEGFDLLRRERANLRPQNEAPEGRPFLESAHSPHPTCLPQFFFILNNHDGKSSISSHLLPNHQPLLPTATASAHPPPLSPACRRHLFSDIQHLQMQPKE